MLSKDIRKLAVTITIDREKQELGVWKLRLTDWTNWYKETLNKFEKYVNDAITAAEQEQEGKTNLIKVQKEADSLKNIVDIRFEQFEKFRDDVHKFQEEYTDTIAKERKKK